MKKLEVFLGLAISVLFLIDAIEFCYQPGILASILAIGNAVGAVAFCWAFVFFLFGGDPDDAGNDEDDGDSDDDNDGALVTTDKHELRMTPQ